MKYLFSTFFWFCCALLMASCQEKEAPQPEPVVEEVPVDTLTVMEHLQERGQLRAVTNRQYVNYRVIEGRPAGFQFELLDDFCELFDLHLDLLVNDSLEECFDMLANGQVDLFAGEIDTLEVIDSGFFSIKLQTPVALDQDIVWIIPNEDGDTSLLSAIEVWLQDYMKSNMKKSFYRYFKGGKNPSSTPSVDNKHICAYDDLIKAQAKKIHWDWRLIASIIYQESHFKPDLESDQGAYGLMQLMPVVMENYGIDYDSPPVDQLEAGGKLLQHLERSLECIPDSLERQKFILAAYNAGLGHVLDARRLAEKYGKDPDVWDDNVDYYILNKSKYYTDPVCTCGPLKGKQTYNFVKEVSKRYNHYKALIEE